MTLEEYNEFCGARPAATHVVQWGGAHVWKVGGKVFAIAGWSESEELAVTFKVSPLAFEVLQAEPGLRPAPYLASRGFKWIQHYDQPGLSDESLRDHIQASYDMIAAALPKTLRQSLDLTP